MGRHRGRVASTSLVANEDEVPAYLTALLCLHGGADFLTRFRLASQPILDIPRAYRSAIRSVDAVLAGALRKQCVPPHALQDLVGFWVDLHARPPCRILVARTRLIAYRAVDNRVYHSVRRFLVRRHKVQSQGTRRFSDEVVHGEFGVLRLRHVHIGAAPTGAR
jgi:hypothetical protein